MTSFTLRWHEKSYPEYKIGYRRGRRSSTRRPTCSSRGRRSCGKGGSVLCFPSFPQLFRTLNRVPRFLLPRAYKQARLLSPRMVTRYSRKSVKDVMRLNKNAAMDGAPVLTAGLREKTTPKNKKKNGGIFSAPNGKRSFVWKLHLLFLKLPRYHA